MSVLGMVIFILITGTADLYFSYKRNKMLEQITKQADRLDEKTKTT